MAENAHRILLVGHGLLDGPEAPATARALSEWAEPEQVALWPLPEPAFLQRMSAASGRLGLTQVAERLAELDDLEALFERLVAERASGREVLGLVVPTQLASSRSGRAWLDRVRAIAAGIAQLSLPVWPLAPGDRIMIEPEAVRTAS